LLKLPVHCALEQCDSELTVLLGAKFGEPDQPSRPSQLAACLGTHFKQFLIFDFHRMPSGRPELLKSHPLFDWLPASIAAEISPQIVMQDDGLKLCGLIDEAWDEDALVCVYSHVDAEQVIQHLQNALHLDVCGKLNLDAKSMLGYCWPSVLSQLLTYRTHGFAQALMGCVGAILIEVPGKPGGWKIFLADSETNLIDDGIFQKFEY